MLLSQFSSYIGLMRGTRLCGLKKVGRKRLTVLVTGRRSSDFGTANSPKMAAVPMCPRGFYRLVQGVGDNRQRTRSRSGVRIPSRPLPLSLFSIIVLIVLLLFHLGGGGD